MLGQRNRNKQMTLNLVGVCFSSLSGHGPGWIFRRLFRWRFGFNRLVLGTLPMNRRLISQGPSASLGVNSKIARHRKTGTRTGYAQDAQNQQHPVIENPAG
jgi:hypothetical protein